MKTTLLFLSVFLSANLFGQNVYIPDANFKAYLVGNSEINTNGDTQIQVSEANSFGGEINNYTGNIADATGIEAFTALTSLKCGNNQLTSLDVSQNTALAILRCEDNQLTSLDVSNNPALEVLYCSDNQLTSLDLSSNTALAGVACYGNQLTSLDLSSNTALEVLYCYGNQLTSLDLSSNTALEVLYCSDNQLECLNVKNGNNTALGDFGDLDFNATDNPNLTCIEVDDEEWSTANWTVIDPQTTFSEYCNSAIDIQVACESYTWIPCVDEPTGCTDPGALNYDANATCDDGSCCYEGCTNGQACNYNPFACVDDGTCLYEGNICDDGNANTILDALGANCQCQGTLITIGCTDSSACNYNPNATVAAVCLYPDGCTSSEACNYNPLAQCDDGTCIYQSSLIYSDEIDNCSNWNLVNAGSPYNPNVTFQCGVGLQPMGQYPIDPIESTTYDNGILMVDSDLNGNDNTCENTWAQRVDPFDLTAYSNVKIGFQNYYRDFSQDCESYLLLEISRDGFTWPDTETFTEAEGMVDFGDGDGSIQARWEVFPDFSNNDYSQNAEWTDFDISEIADGEQVWIRFRWVGSWGYAWMIDDIAVFESPEYDVTLENPSYTNVFNGELSEYTVWHPSQSTTVDIATEVLNNGYSDAVDVDVSIGVNGNTIGQTLLNIESDSTETYAVSYEIPIEPNTYNVDYEAGFSTDECVGNNSFQQSFEVPGPFIDSITGTGGQYARDNGVFNSQQTNWLGGTYNGIGQYYEFFNPADIYGIQVALYDLNSGFVYSELQAAVYQYDGADWYPVEYSDEVLILDGSEELLNSGYESPDQIRWTRFAFETPVSVNEGDIFMAVIEGYTEGVSVGMAESTSSLVDGYVYDGNWYYFNDQTPMIRFNLDPAFEGMSSSCKQPSACNYDNLGTINDPDLCIYSTSVAGLSVTTTPDCGLCNGVVEVEFVNSNNASQYMYNYTWYNSQGDVVSQDGPTFTSACEGEEYYVVVSTNCADSVSPTVTVSNVQEFNFEVNNLLDPAACGTDNNFIYGVFIDDDLSDAQWIEDNTVFYLNDEDNTLPSSCAGGQCDGITVQNPIETTTYTIGVTYTDVCGNIYEADSTFTINVIPPDFNLEIDANPTSGDTPLTVTFDNQTPNLGDYTFTWDFGDGTIVEDNGSFVQHLYESGGLWDVTLTAEENNSGCINELFNPQYIFSIGDGCPQGCTDSTACNYDSSAECDDGSCLEFDECGDCGGNGTLGCTDPTACNYEVQADCDDGSCLQLDECGECGGSGVSGCTDSMACNYDALATCDDDSCLQFDECGECGGSGIQGCTDSDACNYNVAATCEDGTCYFTPDVEITGANVVTAFTSESYEVVLIEGAAYQWTVTGGVTEGASDGYQVSIFWATQGLGELCVTVTNGDCDPVSYCIDLVIAPDSTVTGCTDSEACNYDPIANQDNGNCFFVGDSCNDGNVNTVNDTIQANCNCEGDSIPGCTDATACNYDATATIEDGSCLEEDECGNCGGNETSGCTDSGACNYDADADCDDGTCEFVTCAGCIDATACNYDATATIDDGSCLVEDECGNCGGNETSGCTDADACNYNPSASCDDGTCDFGSCAGCTDPTACNYDPEATTDNGNCISIGDPCNDGNTETIDDTIQNNCECEGLSIPGCTNP